MKHFNGKIKTDFYKVMSVIRTNVKEVNAFSRTTFSSLQFDSILLYKTARALWGCVCGGGGGKQPFSSPTTKTLLALTQPIYLYASSEACC